MTSLLATVLLTLTILVGTIPGVFMLQSAAASRSAAENLDVFAQMEAERLALDLSDETQAASLPLSEVLTEVFRTEGLVGYAVFMARMDITEAGAALVWQRRVVTAGSLVSEDPLPRPQSDYIHEDFASLAAGASILVWRVEFDPAKGGFYCGADECNILVYRVLNNPAL